MSKTPMSEKEKFDAIALALYGFWKAYHESRIAKHEYKIAKARERYYQRTGRMI